ncbi:MAG: CheR family methyltransferase, partial [Acidobacteriota bacterium]
QVALDRQSRESILTSSLKKLEEALAEYYGWATTPASRAKLNAAMACKAGRVRIAQEDYCDIAAASQSEMLALVEEAAFGETGFFRESDQFDLLRTLILPEIWINRPKSEALRLWSSACSTGEEAYSLGMVCDLLRSEGDARTIEIFATDVRNGALLIASQARYLAQSVDALEPAIRERYFVRSPEESESGDGRYSLVPDVRRLVSFRRVNLLEQIFWKSMAGRFDLIVCANLLAFLHGAAVRRMVGRLAHSLREGGYLMVAPTECGFVDHPKLRPTAEAPTFYSRIA